MKNGQIHGGKPVHRVVFLFVLMIFYEDDMLTFLLRSLHLKAGVVHYGIGILVVCKD
jgi:hypothetical protein